MEQPVIRYMESQPMASRKFLDGKQNDLANDKCKVVNAAGETMVCGGRTIVVSSNRMAGWDEEEIRTISYSTQQKYVQNRLIAIVLYKFNVKMFVFQLF